MIQSKPYEFMVSYTPQKQWIEKKGVLLWLAFFFIELGAGMFFVASLFGNLPAMSLGWLLCAVLGGGFHLLYLGKPLRFWRMVLSSGWKTSDIPRLRSRRSLPSPRSGAHGPDPVDDPVHSLTGSGGRVRFPRF